MKIAIIVRRLDLKGGTQRQALSLANELRKRGHTVKLYSIYFDREKCFPDLLEGFDVVSMNPAVHSYLYHVFRAIPLFHFLGTLFDIRHETKTSKALAKLIDPSVELLNSHDRVVHRVAYFFKKNVKKVPSVWNTNDTHSIQWVMDKLTDVDEKYRPERWKRPFYWLRDAYENAKYISAQNAIVVVDKFNQGLVKKYFGREAIEVRSGPDMTQFVYQKRVPPRKESVKLLTSGIFFPHRRFEDAIQAVSLLRSWGYGATLTIIGNPDGDPGYAKKLYALVDELKLKEAVKFLGRVSEEDLLRNYHEHDMYLYPHHLQSDGLSPFEALSTGLPLIVSTTAGAHEIIQDGSTGLWLKPKNPLDLAVKVKKITDDQPLYVKLSEEGSSFVRQNFSWHKYADGMLRVYESVLVKGKSV